MSELTHQHIKARWIAGAFMGMMMAGIIIIVFLVLPHGCDLESQTASNPAPNDQPPPPVTNVSEPTAPAPKPEAPYDPALAAQSARNDVLDALETYSGLSRDAAEQRIRQAEDMAERYGLPTWAGQFMAKEAAITVKIRQEDRKTSGYYYAIPDELEMQNNMILNLVEIVRTPSGSRIGLFELLMQNQNTPEKEMEMCQAFAKIIVSDRGVVASDEYIKNEFGVGASETIEAMGGPIGVLNQIEPRRRYPLILFMLNPEGLANIPNILPPPGK